MVTDETTINLLLDDTDVQAKLAKNQEAIDAQAADWRSKRNQILLEMHAINQGIGLMIQSIRLAVKATGQALDPVANALLSLISSTSSIIIATATALAAGSLGVLTGAALALAAFAYGFSLAQTAKVIAESESLKAAFAGINARLDKLAVTQRPRGYAF